jgi:hypothetical protein
VLMLQHTLFSQLSRPLSGGGASQSLALDLMDINRKEGNSKSHPRDGT